VLSLKLWALGNRSPVLFELGGRLARFITGSKPPDSAGATRWVVRYQDARPLRKSLGGVARNQTCLS
jgi:hypothetical protein